MKTKTSFLPLEVRKGRAWETRSVLEFICSIVFKALQLGYNLFQLTWNSSAKEETDK